MVNNTQERKEQKNTINWCGHMYMRIPIKVVVRIGLLRPNIYKQQKPMSQNFGHNLISQEKSRFPR